jgi:hypothetical protein
MSKDPPYRELLLGCGHRRDKRAVVPKRDNRPDIPPNAWAHLTTLDMSEDVDADIVLDLNMPHALSQQFDPDTFDEVHAYEVVEHLGRQGDFESFFEFFSDVWEILKPNGFFVATVPSRYSPWLWGDPGHTRAILPETLTFLSQAEYARQLDCPEAQRTSLSDYRNIYHADFETYRTMDDKKNHSFCLLAIKPSRIKSR